MKYTILLIAIMGILTWISSENQNAFEQCMNAGIQSEDTCRLYTK